MDPSREKVFMSREASIREAMRVIDQGGLAISLVVDAERGLLGTVTDGDIRRAILAGVDLDGPVEKVMNVAPLTVTPGTDMQEIRRIFVDSLVKHVPVVDGSGRVTDLLTISEFLTVPLSTPDITSSEVEAVLAVLRTPNLSLGPKVIEFERRVAECAQREFAVAVNSGTSGLHLIVRSLGLTEGDEVITTPFSFIASSNCLLYERVTPVFVDIDPDTYNLDPSLVEAAITPRTRAILAVDVFGQPADYDVLDDIARRHGLALISDCCESIGAEFKGRRASTYGAAGVFAFYPNKQITTGEGGAVITDDPEIARLCRSMRNQGRGDADGWTVHERLGYNYRLPDVSCAIGIAQLARIDDILARRDQAAQMYNAALAEVPGVFVPYIAPSTTRMSWFVYVLRLGDEYTREQRDQVAEYMRQHGIGVATYFSPIHLQSFYREQFGFDEGDFPVTEHVASHTLSLPFHNNLAESDCDLVVDHLRSALEDVVQGR